jgi:poly(A) polymerase
MTAEKFRGQSLAILARLRDAGFESYWAGGCVRDILLGRTPKDYDIATRATPDEIQGLFPHTVPVGKAFGVILVVEDGAMHEVATFRRDINYKDGRRPEAVAFTGPEEDARRRDFTVNGLFYDPAEEQVLDFVGGRKDIEARTIRAIGEPADRFREDYLRMLRGARLAATLEMTIEPATAAGIRLHAENILQISPERVRDELTRLLLEAPKAGRGLLLLKDLDLLRFILPEVAALEDQAQPPQFHPEGDVFTHTTMMLDEMESPDEVLAYSVLLHDIGKPPTATLSTEPDGSERIRFNNHAKVGAEMAEAILKRLRFPTRTIEAVRTCVANHMRFMDVPRMKKSTLRKLIGAPTFPVELQLHRLDCMCSHGDLGNLETLADFQRAMADEPVLPEPWVSGHDIMALGVAHGPGVGTWHRRAYERQLEGLAGSRDELLDWLRNAIEAGG